MLSSFGRGLLPPLDLVLVCSRRSTRKALGSPGSYHWPATDDVDLLEVIIREARAIVVKGSSEVMSAEELFGGWRR